MGPQQPTEAVCETSGSRAVRGRQFPFYAGEDFAADFMDANLTFSAAASQYSERGRERSAPSPHLRRSRKGRKVTFKVTFKRRYYSSSGSHCTWVLLPSWFLARRAGKVSKPHQGWIRTTGVCSLSRRHPPPLNYPSLSLSAASPEKLHYLCLCFDLQGCYVAPTQAP